MNRTARRLATGLTALAVGLVALPWGSARAEDPVTVGLSNVKATTAGSASTL